MNSLTTIPENGEADWSKIKIVEGMDLITYYLRTTIQDAYVGQYVNSYDNKCVLVTAVSTFLQELEGKGVLQAGRSYAEIDVEAQRAWLQSEGVDTSNMTDQQVKEADTKSWVFLRCGGRLMDAMEDFAVNYTNLPVADTSAA